MNQPIPAPEYLGALHPGDVLVLRTTHPMSAEAFQFTRERLRGFEEEYGVGVLLLDGTEFEVAEVNPREAL